MVQKLFFIYELLSIWATIINYIPNNIDEIISILNKVLSSILLAYEKIWIYTRLFATWRCFM